jgi:hypothetical protein
MASPKRIPLRDFFRNPERSGYQISPDGNWISFLAPYERRMNVHIMPRTGGEPKRVTSETTRDLAGYFWKSNDRIVFLRDKDGDENWHLYSVARDGEKHIDLTPFPGVTVDIVDDLEDNHSEMLISMNKRNPEIFDVFRLNVETGDMKLVAENPGNITGWNTDHDGNIRVAVATDGVTSSLLYRETEMDPFRHIITTNFKESISPLFFTFDNKYIYCSSNQGRDKAAIVKFDIATGKEMEVLFQHPDVDVSNLSYSHKRKVLTAISFVTWKKERVFLDEDI